MAEERVLVERVGILEAQVHAMEESVKRMDLCIVRVTEAVTLTAKTLAAVESQVSSHDKELIHGREKMKDLREDVSVIKQKCDQTESLRIAGQRHIDEAPKESIQSAGAWMSSRMAINLFLGMMGVWTFMFALLLYLISKGKIVITG